MSVNRLVDHPTEIRSHELGRNETGGEFCSPPVVVSDRNQLTAIPAPAGARRGYTLAGRCRSRTSSLGRCRSLGTSSPRAAGLGRDDPSAARRIENTRVASPENREPSSTRLATPSLSVAPTSCFRSKQSTCATVRRFIFAAEPRRTIAGHSQATTTASLFACTGSIRLLTVTRV